MNPVLLIAEQFVPEVTQISSLGKGLINDTYLVSTKSSTFVLQRINNQVFRQPELIMQNLKALNQHLESNIAGAVKLKIPGILKTREGKFCCYDEQGQCWRALNYIPSTISLESIENCGDAEQVGFALGHFHRLMSNLNPLTLHDTLPGFHITTGYLDHYHTALFQPSSPSALPEERYCATFIAEFQHKAASLETAKQQGLLPVRIIHGDPKLNNFLFDKQTGNIVSLIDLDTVKPGLVHYDIGDCLRSCCHREETDHFDLDICAAILKNYLTEAGAFFTESDYRFLYTAIELIPFELGLRFYTDYLQGNRYFKVSDPQQNLYRACAQFRLCENITAQQLPIEKLIASVTS